MVLTTFLHVKYRQQQEEWGGRFKNLNSWEANSVIISQEHLVAHKLIEIHPGAQIRMYIVIKVFLWIALMARRWEICSQILWTYTAAYYFCVWVCRGVAFAFKPIKRMKVNRRQQLWKALSALCKASSNLCVSGNKAPKVPQNLFVVCGAPILAFGWPRTDNPELPTW